VPLALGAVVMLLMYTWRRGSRLLFDKSRKLEFPLADLVAMLKSGRRSGFPHRRVSHQCSGQCAYRSDAQSEALQGAAREECHSHHRNRTDTTDQPASG